MSHAALSDLRDVGEADVYKGEQLAGTLKRTGEAVSFAYTPEYLAMPGNKPVARTLPKDSEPVVAAGGAVPPFFAGLLPEGIRLQAVVTSARTSADDHLTLLLAVGQDTIGDVRIVPAGTEPIVQSPRLDPSRAHATDLVEVFRAVTTPSADLERMALPGVQAKVSATMISTPLVTTGGPAILKLNPPASYPKLVENEHFFMCMAQACGLPAPRVELLHDRAGRSGLLVKRFDRVLTDGGLERLGQEDACQLLSVYPAQKYRLKTETVAEAVAATVEDGHGSRPLALRRLLELVAFSYLIGNGDLHGKNVSVREGPTGIWEVTPAYDLLSTQPYMSWKDPMALDLFGRANKLDRSHLRWSFERLGLPPRATDGTLDRLSEPVPGRVDRLDEIGFDTPTTERLAAYITARLTELSA